MEAVSVRELRNHTAGIVARVERGETLVLTVHGRPVAEIRPMAEPDSTDWLQSLSERGPMATGWADELDAQKLIDLETDWQD